METQTVILPSIQTLKGKGYTLTVISSQNTQKISVKNRLLTIGTHPDNDVVIQDVVASRFHAKIELDVYGHKVVDDDSKNGVFVNGLRVIKELYLSHQCELQIGTTRLKYEINDQENVEIQLSKEKQFGKLIGESAMMRELFVLLAKIAPTDLTVLVEGESGTGKELVAEALHLNSPRAKQPFVVFDCSAVPTSLIESELFGHLKGSFTGATQDRLGAFQRAEGGTLFLDEMGELPIELQSRVLRQIEI
jgi:transcriptional regulator with GAF, ATPase, and Fis domain